MTSGAKKDEGGGFNPLSRDNIEALTMAIIVAVMLKYFIVEAYKIPTGSMQPTLMGNENTGIFDRIIVDKLSYHYRDPVRWEVAVFKYPLDRSKNFIKRICGMPGEHFSIQEGDLWTRPDETSEWKVLRRPRPVQLEAWLRINPDDPRYRAWKPVDGTRGWTVDGRARVKARGDGAVSLPADGGSVLDMYSDGYPDDMGSMLSRPRFGPQPIADLRVTGEVNALQGCKRVVIELREGGRVYEFVIPGPAAAGDARPRIRATVEPTGGETTTEGVAEAPWQLRAGKGVDFAAQNMDDLLQLEIDGDIVATLEVPRARDQASSFTLRVEGEGADFEDVEIFRDILYGPGGKGRTFEIPLGHYVMLGDNTQDSSDSREWDLATFRFGSAGDGAGERVVRGNKFGEHNPVRRPGHPDGTQVFFRDEWGELHDFIEKPGMEGPLIPAPYVPRNLITGRAVVVFWPMTWLWPPNWGNKRVPVVTRLKWIR